MRIIKKSGRSKDNIPAYIVIVTGGEIEDMEKVQEEIQAAKAAGIEVIVVNVGKNASKRKMRNMIGDDVSVLARRSFKALGNGFAEIAAQICNSKYRKSHFVPL